MEKEYPVKNCLSSIINGLSAVSERKQLGIEETVIEI
jgi:hypothetical protein